MANTQDILYIVLAVAVVWATVFLCWALFELASFMHRANRIVDETTERLSNMEKAVLSLKEKLTNSASALGVIAEGGKAALSMFRAHEEKKAKRGKKSKLFEDEE
jgi:hypothetical protein